ncbi:MAG: hypothetical protein AB1646_01360 [Thermodesulfobacteriota bacterium]
MNVYEQLTKNTTLVGWLQPDYEAKVIAENAGPTSTTTMHPGAELPSEAGPDLPDFCSPFCQARPDSGCMVGGRRWVPFTRLSRCPKSAVFGCESCADHTRGWCFFNRERAVNLEILPVCPREVLDGAANGETWDWTHFARTQGCLGCRLSGLGYGEVRCGYDGQTRTVTNQQPCPLRPSAVAHR